MRCGAGGEDPELIDSRVWVEREAHPQRGPDASPRSGYAIHAPSTNLGNVADDQEPDTLLVHVDGGQNGVGLARARRCERG